MNSIFLDSRTANTAPREKGAVAVEFAIVIIVLLMIVAGVIEFGRAFWHYNALAKATRDGARFFSNVQASTITSAIQTTREMVAAEANAANVSPALTTGNVGVTCLNTTYQPVDCVDGTAPANVRVGISQAWGATSDYTITIGGMIPFFVPGGGTRSFTSTFTPHTTMRYMQ